MLKRTPLFVSAALLAFGCGADADDSTTPEAASAPATEQPAEAFQAGPHGEGASSLDAIGGFINFTTPIPQGNGRACSTCHLPLQNFTITPAEVERQFQENPNGPLFRSIDADDFASDFTTVRTKALFRVTIPLPANIKLADDPAATEVKIFRAVPSVFNVKQTAPYTGDGRELSLFSQAKAAALEHSRPAQNQLPSDSFFQKIAAFQNEMFSSPAVRQASDRIDDGLAPAPVGQDYDGGPLNALEQEGFVAFQNHCIQCHGGNTRSIMTDPFFPGGFAGIGIPEINRAGRQVRGFDVTDPNTGVVTRVNSPDPGRMLITGKLADFNLFDPPTLRGISKTAPYFHDNGVPDLTGVLVHYNLLFAAVGGQLIPTEKFPALVAYLERL